MRPRRLCLSALLAALALGLLAAPATAQSVPNVPGADTIRRAIQDQIARVARQAGLPASAAGALANAAANPSPPPLPAANANNLRPQADQADQPEEEQRDDEPRRESLPNNGVPVVAFALSGIALMSGGKFLLEVTTPWRVR